MRIQTSHLLALTALVLSTWVAGSSAHAGRSLSGRAYDAPIFANRGEEFSVTSIRKEDDHILGSLSFTDISGEGERGAKSNRSKRARGPLKSGDPCQFKRTVERVDIYADGRINQVTQTQSAVCTPTLPKAYNGFKRGPVRQKTSVSSPKLTIVSPDRLTALMAALKSQQTEAESRVIAADSEDQMDSNTPLVLSLSPEPGGSETRAELHRVVTRKPEFNRLAWKSVRRLIQTAISNGS